MIKVVLDLGKHYVMTGQPDGGITMTEDGKALLRTHGIEVSQGQQHPISLVQAGDDMIVADIFQWNPSQDPAVIAAINVLQGKPGVTDAAKCFGYFGFGTGFLKGAAELAVVGDWKVGVFCMACPFREECRSHHLLRADNLGIETGQLAIDNAAAGEAAARQEPMPDRGEATLTWPLPVVQSVIRAN